MHEPWLLSSGMLEYKLLPALKPMMVTILVDFCSDYGENGGADGR